MGCYANLEPTHVCSLGARLASHPSQSYIGNFCPQALAHTLKSVLLTCSNTSAGVLDCKEKRETLMNCELELNRDAINLYIIANEVSITSNSLLSYVHVHPTRSKLRNRY